MPAVGCLRVSSKAPHLLLYFGCLANLPKQPSSQVKFEASFKNPQVFPLPSSFMHQRKKVVYGSLAKFYYVIDPETDKTPLSLPP
jgi:hypothetical protein